MSEFLDGKRIFFKYINRSINSDFHLMVIGYERMEPNTPPKGPYCKTNFTLHYCLKGRGKFTFRGTTYQIGPDDIFLIPPDVVVKYVQDKKDPWEYVWYEFFGKAAYSLLERANITEKNPVLHVATEGLIEPTLRSLGGLDDLNDDLVCTANFYTFLAGLIREQRGQNEARSPKRKVILDDVIKFLDNNFTDPRITLETTSQYFHLNKSYLTRIFKVATNITISEYITMMRINKACELLKNHDLPIKTVAYSVGYNDALYFSRKFKKVMGFSPNKFRSTHIL